MTTTEAFGLTLPRCCAHLMSWDDGPFTAPTHAAVPAGLPAEKRTSESPTAAEPTAVRLSAPRAVGA
ncbi:hypothetical protein [Streptomyces sp. DH10]|uniref:hypothetical protein n=1 Tax=Streptomyces sp. DH10 TaxID=3040121 RepID=UPI002442CF1D|nr:hypothetical protein [Streptomyces sp. DH10]MDG9710517.1 hypothetical protein [Streptomyces sp. DH10]